MATIASPGFVWYPESHKFAIVELRHCQNCGKLKGLHPGFKYCGDCGQRLLSPDPIDAMIQQMIEEQANLLKRKWLRAKLSEECPPPQ